MVSATGIAVERHTFVGTYPGERGQVRIVRADLGLLLNDCPRADDAVLIASELAANAAVHSKSAAVGGRFTVRCEVSWEGSVWIEVRDQGGPWISREDNDDHPHGLDLIHALAGTGNWGIDGNAEYGRVVWARLAGDEKR